jgi:hypothetical protein
VKGKSNKKGKVVGGGSKSYFVQLFTEKNCEMGMVEKEKRRFSYLFCEEERNGKENGEGSWGEQERTGEEELEGKKVIEWGKGNGKESWKWNGKEWATGWGSGLIMGRG